MLQRGGRGPVRERLERLVACAIVAPDERSLAGAVNGVLFLLAGLTLVSFIVLPGVGHSHPAALLIISGVALSWGACSLLLFDWSAAPSWVFHLSSAAWFTIVGAAVASSGGAGSPAWSYLFFAALFTAVFFSRPIAIAYLVICGLTHALPL